MCPDGYFLTTRGVYEVSSRPSGNCPEETTGAVPVTPLLRGNLDWADGASVKIQDADIPVNQFDGSWTYENGVTSWFSLWKKAFSGSAYGGVDSEWNNANYGHPLVEANNNDYTNYCGAKKRSLEEKFGFSAIASIQACADYNSYCLSCYEAGCVFCSDITSGATSCQSTSQNCSSSQNYVPNATCPAGSLIPLRPSPTPVPSPTARTCNQSSLMGVFFAAHAKVQDAFIGSILMF